MYGLRIKFFSNLARTVVCFATKFCTEVYQALGFRMFLIFALSVCLAATMIPVNSRILAAKGGHTNQTFGFGI